MQKRMWIHLVMVFLAVGLFFTVSCAKKTIVSDPAGIEDQAKVEADAKARAAAEMDSAKAEAERIAQQELDDQMANERAIKEAKALAAKNRFENQDVHFEYDSSELSTTAKQILKEKAAWLNENYSASVSVIIEGHCDERGTTEYNLALGERRASEVKVYLVNLGISASRLNTISYGEEHPKDPGKTESAFRENRRVHFAIE